MHPLVRDLWKRVVWVGRDYPTGLEHVKAVWKPAMRNPANCPSWYNDDNNNKTEGTVDGSSSNNNNNDEEELLRAVHKGRLAVKEMMGVIQLKKYRALKQRYENNDQDISSIMERLEQQGRQHQQQR